MVPQTLFLPLASPLHPAEAVEGILRQTQEVLQPLAESLRFHPLVTRREQIPSSSPLAVLFVLTGGVESLGVEVQAEEVLILAHPAMNSLPAALELRTYFQQQGRRAAIFDLDGLRRVLAPKMRAWQVAEAFRGSHFALIGDPSPWLVASMVPPERIEERWGMTIDRVPIGELIERFRRQKVDPMEDWLQAPGPISWEERLQALRTFQALLGFLREHSYNGISLTCFDFLMTTGTAGCLSLASLNDLGVAAACEGDLVSLLTMRLLSLAAGCPTFMANPAWIEEDRVLLAHCTVAPSLVERFTLRTHFESGKSVALAGDFPLGGYTMAKIAPSLEGIFFAPCRSLPWEKRENLCRTQISLHLEDAWRLRELPLANHLVLVPGDWQELLRETAAILGLEILA